MNRQQRVKRSLGQRALRTGPGGRRRFSGDAGNELHQQLGQFHVVHRIADTQRAHAGLGRIVAATGQHGVHRGGHGFVGGQTAVEPRTDLGEVPLARILEVGADLEVPRIFTRLAIDDTRMRRRDDEVGPGIFDVRAEHGLDGVGVLAETDGVFHDIHRLFAVERLVVAEEVAGLGHVGLGLQIVTANDRVVGPLEKPGFAIDDKLGRRECELRIDFFDHPARHGNGRGDVVLGGNFSRRDKILAHTEDAPRTVTGIPDADIAGVDLAFPVAQFIAGIAVDGVDAEPASPVVTPIIFVIALHDKHQILDVLGNVVQPRVVFVGVDFGRGQQFDHRTEGAFRAEQWTPLAVGWRNPEPVEVVSVDDLLDEVEIFFHVGDKHRAVDHRVGNRFGDFRFSPARHGAGLVAQGAFGGFAVETPAAAAGRFEHADLVAGGQHVDIVREQFDFLHPAVALPRHGLFVELDVHILGNVDDRRIFFIDAVAFRFEVHDIGKQAADFGEGLALFRNHAVHGKVFAEIVAGEHKRTAGVFLFGEAEQVGRVTDLGFDFFFAVTEIVVRDDGDDDAAFIARGDLKCRSVVVFLVGFFPAHAVA